MITNPEMESITTYSFTNERTDANEARSHGMKNTFEFNVKWMISCRASSARFLSRQAI